MMIKLGELLVLGRVLSQSQLQNALERQKVMGGRLGTNLLDLGYIDEAQLNQYLAKQHNIPTTPPSALDNLNERTINLIPKQLAHDYMVIPFQKDRTLLHVAMLDPIDLPAIDALSFVTGMTIKVYIVSEVRIYYCLQKYYNINANYRYQQLLRKMEHQTASAASAINAQPISGPTQAPEKLKRFNTDTFLEADSRRSIIAAMCNFLATVCERVMVFIIDNNSVAFWDDIGQFENEKVGEIINLDFNQPSFIKDYLNTTQPFIGSLPKNQQNTRLIGALGDLYPPSAAILPIVLAKDSHCIVYGDNLLSGHDIEHLDEIKRIHVITIYAIKIFFLKRKIKELAEW